ncbi:MFS domain-containing protein [Fusarium sp. Ph1]|nr:MFS domain-containing protein [Fusarium sp. Ph1]
MATVTQTETSSVPATFELQSQHESPRNSLNDTEPEHVSNKPNKADLLRIMSVAFSFFVAGVNDGSIGALVPHVIRDYKVTTAIVSAVYGANFMGWFLAAFSNTHLCQVLDLGAMLALGAGLQVLSHALRAWRPPFALFTITFMLASLGQAYQDTHGNTFVAGVKGSHRWLAFIHAMYMAGCLVGPFVATGVASAGSVSRWYLFYIFPLGIGVLNLVLVSFAFWDTMGIKRKQPVTERTLEADETPASRSEDAFLLMKEALRTKSVWLISLFFFFFLGATLTASGWIVEYLVAVRDGDINQMGFVPAGFSGGSLLGRLFLAEPTHRFGVRRMIFGFTIISIGLQVLFWLVPNIIAASIAISLLGFFMGPYFATGISVGSKLFAPRIRSTALSFVFVFAQLGGCLFPIITGLVAASAGVAVLQPVLCGLLTATAVTWLFVPMPKEGDNPALHQE